MKHIITFCCSTILSVFAFAQNSIHIDCSIMRHGSFKYLDIEDTTAYFKLDGENHIEYHQGGRYYIKSIIKWLNDCQYEMKMTENTIPDFPFKPGDVMIVTIVRIKNNVIHYISEVKGNKWKGRVLKIE